MVRRSVGIVLTDIYGYMVAVAMTVDCLRNVGQLRPEYVGGKFVNLIVYYLYGRLNFLCELMRNNKNFVMIFYSHFKLFQVPHILLSY